MTEPATIESKQQRLDRHVEEGKKAHDDSVSYYNDIVIKCMNNPALYNPERNQHLDIDYFAENRQFLDRATRRYFERVNVQPVRDYMGQEERIPANYPSNDAAEIILKDARDKFLMSQAASAGKTQTKKYLALPEAAEVFISSGLAATVATMDGYEVSTLLVYDYDDQIYKSNENLLGRWTALLTGVASPTNVRTLAATLHARSHELTVYRPAPRWKIAVGNGLYNTISGELEAYTPMITVTNRIETNYYPHAQEPGFAEGMTFEKLTYDLADGKQERAELIMQMVKAILVGHSPSPALFTMVGAGGDGKSLFMDLIARVVGSKNTGYLNFTDMDDESKVVEIMGRRLVVGSDNDGSSFVKSSTVLKGLATNDMLTLPRKYQSAVSMRFEGTVVQLCNSMPRMAESGSAMRRRLVTLLCNNSHYERGDEMRDLPERVKDRRWHEYILSYVLSEVPYYTDFNDCDKAVMNDSLDADDPIGTFMTELVESTSLLTSNEVTAIPRNILYAAFRDWMEANQPKASIHSARTFATKANDFLRDYGFESDSSASSRITTVERASGIGFQELLGGLGDGPICTELFQADRSSRRVVRVRKVEEVKTRRRRGDRQPRQCTPMEYFGVYADVIDDVQHYPQSYVSLLDDMGIEYEVEQLSEPTRPVLAGMGDAKLSEPIPQWDTSTKVTGADLVARVSGKNPDQQSVQSQFVVDTSIYHESQREGVLVVPENVHDKLAVAVKGTDTDEAMELYTWLVTALNARRADEVSELDFAVAVDRLRGSMETFAHAKSMVALQTRLMGLRDDESVVMAEELEKVFESHFLDL